MKFLIPIIIGAIIGYTTNWIAIRMLFRPHYEKQFLGIHIPFTPGLIPKERNRIAKSIGEAIGSYILTPQVIIGSLSHRKLEYYVENWIKAGVDSLKKQNKSIREIIGQYKVEGYQLPLEGMKKWIGDTIYIQINRSDFKANLTNQITQYILVNENENLFTLMDEASRTFLNRIANSHRTKDKLRDTLETWAEKLRNDDRKLEDILPDEYKITMRELIAGQGENIIHSLKHILDAPAMEIKVRNTITNIVSANMNRTIAIFLNPEMISDKIFDIIKENISNEEFEESVDLALIMIADKILESRIEDLTKEILLKFKGQEIYEISDIILKFLTREENIANILVGISEEINSLKPDLRIKVLEVTNSNINNLLESERTKKWIYLGVEQMIGSFLDSPIGAMVTYIDAGAIKGIIGYFKQTFDYIIQNKLPGIIELFNISKVVEKQIESFDVEFAEEIILEVVHKELKAITWLGAALGGIMGILSPLLQKI